MTPTQIITSAQCHLHKAAMQGSARICLEDAMALDRAGWVQRAVRRAIDSLRYSVGVFHPDYQAASAALPAIDYAVALVAHDWNSPPPQALVSLQQGCDPVAVVWNSIAPTHYRIGSQHPSIVEPLREGDH